MYVFFILCQEWEFGGIVVIFGSYPSGSSSIKVGVIIIGGGYMGLKENVNGCCQLTRLGNKSNY